MQKLNNFANMAKMYKSQKNAVSNFWIYHLIFKTHTKYNKIKI